MIRAVVVTGAIHSGTSLVACALHFLGVHSGNAVAPRFEDVKFFDDVKGYANSKAEFEKWFIKYPNFSGHHLSEIDNPFLIIVNRSVEDAYATRFRNVLGLPEISKEDFYTAYQQQVANTQLHKQMYPHIELDFDAIHADKPAFINLLIDTLGLEPTAQQIDDALQSIEQNTYFGI